MELSGVIERLERAISVCGSPDSTPGELRDALAATTAVQSFVDARRAELVSALRAHPTAFAEATIADTSGCSLGQASKETDRAATLGAASAMAEALSDGAITSAHVDALTRAARNLDSSGTDTLLADSSLAEYASRQSVAEFDAHVKRRAKALDRSDGEKRLDRQRRATRLRSWTDVDGMWNLRGCFDPELGKDLAKRLASGQAATFVAELPATAPADPIERSQHLAALTLADLLLGQGGGARSGPPVVILDATQTDGAGGPLIDWGIPVELPVSVLAGIFGARDPEVVIVSNGLVVHAPGRTDLGRHTRLANRAQRRALRGLYSTCAIPGCSVHVDRCKLHHVVWWRHGGGTDLENLLPVCQHHHTRIHEDGWEIVLGARRELTISLPDGQIMRTGPPRRRAS